MKLAVMLVLIVVATAIYPLLSYIWVGWKAKRNDVMDGLGPDARRAYFEMFAPSERVTPSDAFLKFEAIYDRWYGRSHFVLPTALVLVAFTIGAVLVISTVMRVLANMQTPLFPLPETAVAALAGAYMWIVNDFISRSSRLDFSPSDVLSAVLRLVVAVPLGYAFSSVLTGAVAPFVAFALGAFPLAALTAMLRNLLRKTAAMEQSAQEALDDISKLQGVDKAIAARLANQDITTVAQIAYCDPVRVTMGSNLTFAFVTDLMGQALAFMYLRDKLDLIRPLGLRGAVEIKHFVDELDDPDHPLSQGRAVAALPGIATALGQTAETTQVVLREIAHDPYTLFLDEVWNCLDTAIEPAPVTPAVAVPA